MIICGFRKFIAAQFLAICLVKFPLHAEAIVNAVANTAKLSPPFINNSCNQISHGPGFQSVQCNITTFLAGADAQASANFGALSVQTSVGAEGSFASAVATASFNSDVIFTQTGVITGKWFVDLQDQGIFVTGSRFSSGDLTIMGINAIPTTASSGSFHLTLPFAYSGGPIPISAMARVLDIAPGSQNSSIFLDLESFSSPYKILPDVPEPGTFGLAGLGIFLMAFAIHMHAQRLA